MAEKISIILPVYNEGKILRQNIPKLEKALSRIFDDFEIIVSENGSTDDTVFAAESARSDRILVLHEKARLGKGAAIKSAAHHTSGQIIIFMDADLASKPEHAAELVRNIEDGSDIVVGSRYLPESRVKRTMMRDIASRGFNWLVRASLGSRLRDHQCGFKSFRKDSVLPVIDEIQDQRWFWDTELLIRAQRHGLVVKETPIEWTEAQDSKFRLFEDSAQMFKALVRFKMRDK